MSRDGWWRVQGHSATLLAATLAGALVVMLLAAAPALAQQATQDAYTSSLNPDTNFGDSQRLLVGHNGVGKNTRTYLKFPDSAVYNPNCQVAQSILYFASNSGLWTSQNFRVAPAVTGWIEKNDPNAIDWNNQPGLVTSADISVTFGGNNTLVSAFVTEPVQWLDNNALPQRGLVVRSTTTGDTIDREEAFSREANATWPALSTIWSC
jgi:hypothetical protein